MTDHIAYRYNQLNSVCMYAYNFIRFSNNNNVLIPFYGVHQFHFIQNGTNEFDCLPWLYIMMLKTMQPSHLCVHKIRTKCIYTHAICVISDAHEKTNVQHATQQTC